MSKFNKGQTSFVAGEISDRSKGRVDLEQYGQACDRLENYIVQRQGGAVKRPGTRFLVDLESSSFFIGDRSIPFSASNTDGYSVVFDSNFGSITPIRIFRNDGTECTVNTEDFLNPTSLTGYNPKNWKYSQDSDVLVLTYSDPGIEGESATTSITKATSIAPVFIFRTSPTVFNVVTFSSPYFFDKIPSVGKLNPAVNRPYLDPNIDPDLRLYVSNVAVGTGRALVMVDRNSIPTPFFKLGHTFGSSSSFERVGAYFKVQSGSSEGVAFGEDWKADILVMSANINTGTDVVNATAHGYLTRDLVTLNVTGGPGTTDPVIDGYPLTADGYGQFYVRFIDANNITFHPTLADADANTNIINFTDAGDRGLRIQAECVSQISATVEVAFPAGVDTPANASDNWQEAAWSTEQGFPRAVVFHEQRLIFGGTRRRPSDVFCSNIGNIFNFMARRLQQDTAAPTAFGQTHTGFNFALFGDVKTTDPFSFTISAKQTNIIQWLESQNVLLLGTLGAEYTISGGDLTLSNESVFVTKQTDYGSNNTEAVSIGVATLFVSRDGRRVRSFKFNRDNGSYVSVNLSILADHMVFKGFDEQASSTLKNVEIKEMHYQPSRDTLWCVTSNFEVIALTLSRESNVQAWHYHTTRSGDKFRSLSIIPSQNGSYDEIWCVVERSINGGTKRYLEKMGDDFEHTFLDNSSSEDDDKAWYSDSSVRYEFVGAGTVITGLGHLESETVNVLSGSSVYKSLTVTGGQVTLPESQDAGTIAIVGLPYRARLRTVDIEAGGDFGVSQGNRQRIDRLAVRLYRSQGGEYGNSNQATLYPLEYVDNEVVTEIRRLEFEITPNIDNQVVFEHDDPTPFNIVAITYRGVSYD